MKFMSDSKENEITKQKTRQVQNQGSDKHSAPILPAGAGHFLLPMRLTDPSIAAHRETGFFFIGCKIFKNQFELLFGFH